MSYWDFRNRFSKQMLLYDPTKRLHPGDDAYRGASTRQHKKRRAISPENVSRNKGGDDEDSMICYAEPYSLASGRVQDSHLHWLCGDLRKLREHAKSVEKIRHKRTCAACRYPCNHVCTLCGLAVHFFPNRGNVGTDRACLLELHDDACLGMVYVDHGTLIDKSKKEYSTPDSNTMEIHGAYAVKKAKRIRMHRRFSV